MTAKQNNCANKEMVRDFLLNNPSFLEQNPDILEAINVSHHSGKAVSLVERQVSVMRDRNKEMSARVDQMVASATENALLFEKTNRLVLRLLQAQDLSALVTALYLSLKEDFSTEFYSLTLLDNSAIQADSGANVVDKGEAKAKIGAILLANKAVCGVIRDKEIALLFGDQGAKIKSVVALPLGNETRFGVIALGNTDSEFYSRNVGTLFIDYIGELLTQLLPRHIGTITQQSHIGTSV